MKDARFIFGALIAVILLGLYGYSIYSAIDLAFHLPPSAKTAVLPNGVAFTMSTVGGLVSALVIAELAITKPGEAPLGRTLAQAAQNGNPAGQTTTRSVAVLSGLYVLVWIALGLAAFVVGVLIKEGAVGALTDFGRTWLGLAVAAGYAYFGLGRPA